MFVIVAILGSLVLTASAKSAPLAGAWDDLKPWLLDVSADDRAVPADAPEQPRHRRRPVRPGRPDPRHVDHRRGARGDDPAHARRRLRLLLAARSPTTSSTTTAGNGPAATTRSGSRATRTRRSSRTPPRRSPKPGTKDVTFSVAPDQLRGTYALSPAVPLQIDRPADLLGGRQAGLLPGDRDQRPRPVHDHGPGPAPGRRRRRPDPGQAQGGRPELPARDPRPVHPARAGRRRQGRPGRAGRRPPADEGRRRPPTTRTTSRLPSSTSSTRSRFTYTTNVLDVNCGKMSVAECFAASKRGYCEHYATLMTVLLREHRHPGPVRRGLPAGHARQADRRRAGLQLERPRLGRGLLPGLRLVHVRPDRQRPGRDRAAAQRQAGRERPAEPVPEPRSPNPRSATTVATSREPGHRAGAGGRDGGVGPGGFILIAAVLFATMAIVAFLVWRRGPRGAGDTRDAPGPESAGSRRDSASGRDRRRPPTSTRRPSARSCPASGPSCRRSRPRRSRSPTAAGPSVRTGSRRSASRTRSCGSGCCGCCSGAASGSASSAEPPARLERPRPPPLVGLGAGLLVEDRREMVDEVHRPDERPAAADLDHDDPGEVERPHPEPLERQVEQRQQQDLEDAVVADDDRPRAAVGLRIAVARDLRPVERPRRPRGGEARQDPAECRPEPGLDVRQRLAARGPGLERPPPPRREDVAPAGLDLRAVEPLPLALADLDEAGIRADGDDRAERRRICHRRRDRAGRRRGPGERRMDDLERRRRRDRQRGRRCGMGQPRPDEAGLGDARRARAGYRPGPGSDPRR